MNAQFFPLPGSSSSRRSPGRKAKRDCTVSGEVGKTMLATSVVEFAIWFCEP